MANALQRSAAQRPKAEKGKVAGGITPAGPVSGRDAVAALKGKTVKAAAPKVKAEKAPAKEKGPSIRGTIVGLLEQGKTTEEITKVIQEKFPDSKAAEKPGTHISFYRSKLKHASK